MTKSAVVYSSNTTHFFRQPIYVYLAKQTLQPKNIDYIKKLLSLLGWILQY
jgi:hypothetical protein